MATDTYSLAITGYSTAQQPGLATAQKNVVIGDSGVNCPGQENQAMSQNRQVLCKNPDGSLSWYTYDAERSIPGVLRIMKRV